MDLKSIKVDIKDYVATVTLDNPPVNALDVSIYLEIQQAFDSLSNREDVRAAVLTGAGKHFCAGANIRSVPLGPYEARGRAAREAFWSIVECTVPVIAAVHGAALGGGTALCAVADIVLAAEDAIFGLPEIDVGLLGGGKMAMRLVSLHKARKMMYTGERIGAQEMYRLGALDRVVPLDRLMPEALELAHTIASKSPLAIRLAKLAMNQIEFMSLREGYRFEQDQTALLQRSEDAKEARAAFVEKRAPRWKGR